MLALGKARGEYFLDSSLPVIVVINVSGGPEIDSTCVSVTVANAVEKSVLVDA